LFCSHHQKSPGKQATSLIYQADPATSFGKMSNHPQAKIHHEKLTSRGWRALLHEERFLGVGVLTSLAFLCFGGSIMGSTEDPLRLGLVFAWLFAAALGCVLGVVRHADHLADRLGEPYGTLILTLTVTSIEVISISSVMLHGANNPTLVRDTLFAVVMIIFNGMVGLCLLIGGLRHREQQYNLQGANAYLSVIIPLAVLSLILPTYTVSTSGPTLSWIQEVFLAIMTAGLYAVFLLIQTRRHRGYFTLGEGDDGHEPAKSNRHPLGMQTALLVVYMVPVVYLAKQLAQPVDNLIEVVHAPAALGGIVIALLVVTPEAISAVRAARANRLQRSVNIFLGSVLATISLTIPCMMVISHLTGKSLILGVEHADLVLLPLTLAVSIITFSSVRTNILQGAVHLVLFAAYVMLVFQG
jgi:Ca2+:H+ antiporter